MVAHKHKPKARTGANPCWKGYIKLGMKLKNGKKVPDCVPAKRKR